MISGIFCNGGIGMVLPRTADKLIDVVLPYKCNACLYSHRIGFPQ